MNWCSIHTQWCSGCTNDDTVLMDCDEQGCHRLTQEFHTGQSSTLPVVIELSRQRLQVGQRLSFQMCVLCFPSPFSSQIMGYSRHNNPMFFKSIHRPGHL